MNTLLFKKLSCIAAGVGLLLLTSLAARATVIAFDQFSYSAGELNGQGTNNGTNDSGWNDGGWSANTTYSDVSSSPTMTYSYGNVTLGGGNNARVGDWAGGTKVYNAAYRQLASPFGDDAGEDALYVRFLVNFEGTADYKDDFLLWLDDNAGTANDSHSYNTPYVKFSSDYYGGGNTDWIGGTSSNFWAGPADANMNESETHLLVVKFWKSDPTGTNTFDSLSIWFDPVAGDENNPGATKTGDANATLTSISYVGLQLGKNWDAGDWMHIDALKLGTTFDDVVPVPEPSTILLCGLGIMGLAASRRNKKQARK